jgi:hypothetical protein
MTGGLPGWAQMTDLDKGAALLHLHKRQWEGADYAESDYPARYLENPALVALAPAEACRHAVSVKPDAYEALFAAKGALGPAEYDRLYDLALAADRAQMQAEIAAEREAGQ